MARVRQRNIRVRQRKLNPGSKDNSGDRQRYIALAYMIIEYKIMYYYPELIREGFRPGLTISDDEYDKLEIEYLSLCKKLGLPNTVVHKCYPGLDEETIDWREMFEVDFTRPVVHLVMRKYGIKNWQRKAF